MELPKQLTKEDLESDVREALERESIAICADSELSIPILDLNPEMSQQIFYAKSIGEVTIGYANIEKRLLHEQRGLQKVDNQAGRVSRLLLVTNDGSPRFYRELEFLHKKQGGRVLICRLDVDSAILGGILALKNTPVKAVLLNRKPSVVNVLKSLIRKPEWRLGKLGLQRQV